MFLPGPTLDLAFDPRLIFTSTNSYSVSEQNNRFMSSSYLPDQLHAIESICPTLTSATARCKLYLNTVFLLYGIDSIATPIINGKYEPLETTNCHASL